MHRWRRADTAGPRKWSEPDFHGLAGCALGTGGSSSLSNRKTPALVYSSLQEADTCTDEDGVCTDETSSPTMMYDYGVDDTTTATMTMTTATMTTTMAITAKTPSRLSLVGTHHNFQTPYTNAAGNGADSAGFMLTFALCCGHRHGLIQPNVHAACCLQSYGAMVPCLTQETRQIKSCFFQLAAEDSAWDPIIQWLVP